MKTPLAFVLALALATLAAAADLALKDGRVLRNAVVTKQDPTTITVRHSEGFSQVEKSKLPDELAAQYPVDEAAAARQRTIEGNERVEAVAELNRKRARKANEAAARVMALQASPEYKRNQSIKNAVGSYIHNHFAKWYPKGSKRWGYQIPEYTLEDPVALPTSGSSWTVDGVVKSKDGSEDQRITATVIFAHGSYSVMEFERH